MTTLQVQIDEFKKVDDEIHIQSEPLNIKFSPEEIEDLKVLLNQYTFSLFVY